MIHLDFPNIKAIEDAHFSAVMRYMMSCPQAEVQSVYDHIRQLPEFTGLPAVCNDEDWSWLERFILADVETMRAWTVNHPDKLDFVYFRKIYKDKFANGEITYVDNRLQYNAFKLFEMMSWRVCPYCDDESMNIVEQEVKGETKKRRTLDFEHFFPKKDGKFPALAMCLYNLIPSGKVCNNLKMTNDVEASPCSADIESESHFWLEHPIGANWEKLKSSDCTLHLDVTGKMISNNNVLALEQRYRDNHSEEAYRLKRTRALYPDERLEEMERSGFGSKESLIENFFGEPYSIGKGKNRLQKMKHDLINY